MDWDAYQRCVDACEARGVYTVADFQGRVLSGENYADKWLKWCEEMRHALAAERRMAREHETAFEK